MILSGDFQSEATASWRVAIFAGNDDAEGTRAHHALDVVNLVDRRALVIQKFVLLPQQTHPLQPNTLRPNDLQP